MSLGPGLYFLVSLILTCTVAAAMAVYARRRRDVPGSGNFFLLALCLSFLALTEILTLFSGSAGQALFWFKIRFIVNALIPVFFLRFALSYTGRNAWVSRPLAAGFFIIPVLTQVMIWTNETHHFFVKREVAFSLKGSFWIADTGARQAGIGFLAYSVYGLILLIAAIVLLSVLILRKKPRDIGQVAFIGAGGMVAFIDTMVSTFNLYPTAEFNTFTPGLGLSFALIAIAAFRFRLFRRVPAEGHVPGDLVSGRFAALFFLILAVLASGVIAVGYVSFRDFESNLRAQAEKQISAVAELKAGELSDWRGERLADAELLQRDAYFSGLVQMFFTRPSDLENRQELQSRLLRYQTYRQYLRTYLLDLDGTARLSVPAPPDEAGFRSDREFVAETFRDGRPRIVDFHRDAEGAPIHISIYVPIYSFPMRGREVKPLGAVVFLIDPSMYLYPYILEWPGPNQSAETLLVRREGDEVLYLNDLKYLPGAGLTLRIPLIRTEVPAVQAVLGRTGVFEGRDYRGAPVLSFLRAIPDSPWFLVARIDQAEIYAPVRQRLRQTLVLLAALIAASGFGLGSILRRQRLQYFRGRAEIGQKLRDSLERFELANRATFDVIWDWDFRTDTVWRNEHLQGIFGFRPEELEDGTRSWKARLHPEDQERVYSGIQAVIDGGGQFWSDHYRFLHKDGRYLDIFDRGYVIRDAAGKPFRMIGAMQDLTERIAAEKEVIHSRDLMRYIIEHNRSAVAVHDRDLKYLYVSQRYLDDYHVKEKDIIGRHHYDVFPDLPQKWRDIHQKALAGIVSSAEDDPYPRADGTIDWTRWECRPWYEADGSVGGIIVYTEVVTERKKSQDALRTSLREKEVLLKEIHHRVKNNMQVISSLLNLQASVIGDPRLQDALKETQRRIRSMALLHEKLYKSQDLSRIDFVEYAQSLASHLYHSFPLNPGKITLRFEMEPAFFDITTANPLGLILNELFSNAMKHAFPGDRRGEIRVGLRRLERNEFLLTVQDNGVGLPPGFDLEGKSTFGIQIIDSLVTQLNGTMTVGTRDVGASFEVRFEELHYPPRFDPNINQPA